MTRCISALRACGWTVLVLTIATSGSTYAGSRTSHLTFSGPVGLPGVTLARGTYTFEVIQDLPSLVRVWSQDCSVVYTGFTRRLETPVRQRASRPVVLAETPRGVPPRIRIWYPETERAGYQFIYRDDTY